MPSKFKSFASLKNIATRGKRSAPTLFRLIRTGAEQASRIRKAPPFLDSTLGGIALATLLCFVGVEVYFSFLSNVDTYDGYFFLSQSRRLTDPAFANSPLFMIRPRGLIIFLSLYEIIFKSLVGRFPNFAEYHILTTTIAVAFIGVWQKIVTDLFNRSVGYFVVIGLCVNHIFVLSPLYSLSDTLAGLILGLALLWLLRYVAKQSAEDTKREARYAVGFGVIGALVSVSKYQQLVMFPGMLCCLFLGYQIFPEYRKTKAATVRRMFVFAGDAGLSFLVSLEIIQRVFATSWQGLGPFLRTVLSYSKLKITWYKPWWYYGGQMLESYGPFFFLMLAVAVGVTIWGWRRVPGFEWSAAKKLQMTLFGGTVFVSYAVIQKFAYGEGRYLLPVLPGILALIAIPVTRNIGLMSAKVKTTWLILWVFAFIHPILCVTGVLRAQYFFVSSHSHKDRASFWSYLNSPSPVRGPCSEIFVCGSFRHHEDFGPPAYQFMTGKLPTINACGKGSDRTQLREKLAKTPDLNACYVLRQTTNNPELFDTLIVQKPLALGITAEEADTFREKPVRNEEKVWCEASGQGFNCFAEKSFFGQTKINSPIEAWAMSAPAVVK